MLQRELGGSGFFGRLQPDCVVTDDSEAERAALRQIWPNAKQFLCVFHVLQAAWRWLWLAKHKIPLQHRKPLILILKSLVYSQSREAFDQTWNDFLDSDLSQQYPQCSE